MRRFVGLRWIRAADATLPYDNHWDLVLGKSKIPIATVWQNGTWHTFDHSLGCGENSVETSFGAPDVNKAFREATMSAIQQGFI